MPISTKSQDSKSIQVETVDKLSPLDSDNRPTEYKSLLGGLLVRRAVWKLSWLGKSLLILIILFILFAGLHLSYPFLAITDLSSRQVIVVEGWIHPYTLPQVANEITNRNYEKVLIVRPIYKAGDKYTSGQYAADYVAEKLIQEGVSRESIQSIYLEASNKDRTFYSALAAKQWLKNQGISCDSVDVATLGSHARRSRLLFQKAFGDRIKVGILSAQDRLFDYKHWWRSSEGVREVPFELFAYFYAKFLFYPSREDY